MDFLETNQCIFINNHRSLVAACQSNLVEIVKLLLLDCYVPVDVDCIIEGNPLYAAIESDSVEIVELLLAQPESKISFEYCGDERYDYEIPDKIRCLFKKGNKRMVKALLANPTFSPDCDKNYALRMSIEFSHMEIVKILMEDPRIDHQVASMDIFNYFFYSELKYLKRILSIPNIDPGVDNNYLIRRCVCWDQLDRVQLLLEDPWVDPSANDNEAIKTAHKKGYTKIVKLLLGDKRLKKDSFVKKLIKEFC